jgi:hypothetical protein
MMMAQPPLMPMVNDLHNWHTSGSFGSLDSLDVSQCVKPMKTVASLSIGLLVDSFGIFYPSDVRYIALGYLVVYLLAPPRTREKIEENQ